jgi:two-component system LytT family response regulator
MKALIVDDEPHCIGALEIILEDVAPEVEVLATCTSGKEALKALELHDPEVLFLDIAMPRMNGFEMLAQVEDPQFEIVFTTAYDRYALQALKVSAVDYLLKPIDVDELQQALVKVKQRIVAKQTIKDSSSPFTSPAERWTMVLENFRNDAPAFPNIAFPTANGYEMVRIADILYVEADGNYTRIYLDEKKSIYISKTLKDIQKLLVHYPFVRVHHSHLVNRNHIKRYIRGEGGQVVLGNGDTINVSRRRKPELMRALKHLS